LVQGQPATGLVLPRALG